MPYCTSYLKFLFDWFWGFPEQNKVFAIQNMGERGYHFVSIAHRISNLSSTNDVFIYKFLLLFVLKYGVIFDIM